MQWRFTGSMAAMCSVAQLATRQGLSEQQRQDAQDAYLDLVEYTGLLNARTALTETVTLDTLYKTEPALCQKAVTALLVCFQQTLSLQQRMSDLAVAEAAMTLPKTFPTMRLSELALCLFQAKSGDSRYTPMYHASLDLARLGDWITTYLDLEKSEQMERLHKEETEAGRKHDEQTVDNYRRAYTAAMERSEVEAAERAWKKLLAQIKQRLTERLELKNTKGERFTVGQAVLVNTRGRLQQLGVIEYRQTVPLKKLAEPLKDAAGKVILGEDKKPMAAIQPKDYHTLFELGIQLLDAEFSHIEGPQGWVPIQQVEDITAFEVPVAEDTRTEEEKALQAAYDAGQIKPGKQY